MKIFTLKNLTETSGEFTQLPWEFKFDSASIPEEVRKNKNKRQDWCTNPAIKHCFYSCTVGVAEYSRVNKDNPPKELWLFAADYDCVISDERLQEVIKTMKIKPTYIETSIGGNRRLVWVLEIPILLGSNEFASFVMQKAESWLRLSLLPMLDQGAFFTTSRLLCVGDKWEATGHGPVPKDVVQAFFFDCGKAFNFKSTAEIVVPLDVVEKELKTKFPDTFKWPGDFSLGTMGPSFWVPDSKSPASAMVKSEGMFTYAGHATKPFYPWGDLLGQEFVKEYRTSAIAKATHDIWYDGLKYHRKIEGKYKSMTKDTFTIYLTVRCGLSEKADSSGTSPVRQAIQHIHDYQSVEGAAPFIPLESGVITYQTHRYLNTNSTSPMEPASGIQHWGPMGNFPWLSEMLDTLFFPREQKEYILAWWKYYYVGMRKHLLRPGQYVIMEGPAGCGKSLFNRYIVGKSVGGFCDPAKFVLGGSNFNSELFNWPHWALDDDSPSASLHASGGAHTVFKQLVANDAFLYSKKYEVSTMVERGARLMATINPDGRRMIPPLDGDMKQKVTLVKCSDPKAGEKGDFRFPRDREDIKRIIERELPFLLAWLEQWEVPPHIVDEGDGRFGTVAYHEASMVETSAQAGAAAPFKEILLESLYEWFRQNPDKNAFTGSSNQVMACIGADLSNQNALRSYKPEKISSHLELLGKENFLGLTCKTQPGTGIRLWTFQKPTAPTTE